MRGECRESAWPYPALQVLPARICGILYDLGDYPALVVGNGCVEGELWVLAPQHVPPTLSVLDRIEGTPDLYVRTVSQVQLVRTGSEVLQFAFVYLYTNICEDGCVRPILPDRDGVSRWKR